MLSGKKLLLASGSPRRRELLSALDIDTRVVSLANVDESYPVGLSPDKVAEYVACKKRDAYDCDSLGKDEILVTADTVVVQDGKVLGKPHDADNAREMLKLLSGKTHEVITGVTLSTKDKTISFSSVTKVQFDPLTESEIEFYIDHYKPFDKAGAYGIQEWIGYIGIKGIEGCYYNVMGLPLHDLYRHLRDFA